MERPTTQDMMLLYGVLHAKRASRKEKTRYIGGMAHDMSQTGYRADLLTDSVSEVRNLVFGNVEKAETVVVSYFDTPKRLVAKLFHYFPFSSVKTALYEKRARNVITYLSTSLFGICAAFAFTAFTTEGSVYLKVPLCAAAAVFALITALSIAKIPNRRNFGMNTAADVAILQCSSQLSDKARSKTAFVVLDDHFGRRRGTKMFLEKYGKCLEDKRIVFIEAAAFGEKLFVAGNEEESARMLTCFDEGDYPAEVFNSEPMEHWNYFGDAACRAVKISAGNKIGEDVVTPNVCTQNDYDYEPELVETLGRVLARYSEL